jgi:hypothetical protein
MTTLVHAIPRFSHVRGHVTAYLAGLGATAALTAGAVVVFLSMATFVAFNGLPSFAGSGDGVGAAHLDSTSAPTATGAALGAAGGAVAKNPVPGARRGNSTVGGSFGADGSGGGKSSGGSKSSGAGGSSGGGSGGPGGGSTDPGGPGATPPPGSGPSVPNPPGGVNPPAVNVPSIPDVPSIPNPPRDVNPPRINLPSVPNLPSVSGPVGGAVRRVDDAAGTNLSGPTGRVTRAVDGVTAGLLG